MLWAREVLVEGSSLLQEAQHRPLSGLLGSQGLVKPDLVGILPHLPILLGTEDLIKLLGQC